MTVYGSSLHETYLITLPGGIEVTDNIENDPDGEWYSFVMPSGVSQAGCITSDGANGKAQSPDFFNNLQLYDPRLRRQRRARILGLVKQRRERQTSSPESQ